MQKRAGHHRPALFVSCALYSVFQVEKNSNSFRFVAIIRQKPHGSPWGFRDSASKNIIALPNERIIPAQRQNENEQPESRSFSLDILYLDQDPVEKVSWHYMTKDEQQTALPILLASLYLYTLFNLSSAYSLQDCTSFFNVYRILDLAAFWQEEGEHLGQLLA